MTDDARPGEVVERMVMVCPQCEGEGGYPDGLDEAACHTDCTRCGGNGWIVDMSRLAFPQPTADRSEAEDMAAFGASHAACYLYPGVDQQAERSAYCEGAASMAVDRSEAEAREAIAREIERYGEGLIASLQPVCDWLAVHFRKADIDFFARPEAPAPAQPVGGEVGVLIWSGEHHAYWRPNSAGYTTDGLGAGIYSRKEAESIARSCDPDKKIVLREIDFSWPLLAALATAAPTDQALLDVATERARQIGAEGWTPEHDDQHDDGSLALAAALYAAPEPLRRVTVGPNGMTAIDPWPWVRRCWAGREQAGDPMMGRINEGDGRLKHDRRRQIVIAGALIVAEIERLDRAVLATPRKDEA